MTTTSDTAPVPPVDAIKGEGDATPADPAPKRARGGRAPRKPKDDTAPRPPGRPVGSGTKKAKRADAAAGLYLTTAMGLDISAGLLAVPGFAGDAAAIRDHAADLGAAWAELAETNGTVAKWLDGLGQGNAWAGVLMAHLPLAMAIMANHAPAPIEAAAA